MNPSVRTEYRGFCTWLGWTWLGALLATLDGIRGPRYRVLLGMEGRRPPDSVNIEFGGIIYL